MKPCSVCKREFPPEYIRPYGHGGTDICYECGHSPALADEVSRNLGACMDAMMQSATDTGRALRLDPEGPRVVGLLERRVDDIVLKVPLSSKP